MATDTAMEVRSGNQAKVAPTPEHTRSGPVYTPAVDIFETPERITVLADMPGVTAQNLTIDLREDVLTLSGNMEAPSGEATTDLLTEVPAGTFFRQFNLSETIDQGRIDATLTDGVLRLDLPKVERARPRQINVRTG
jgi:HSP20 family molecular chaperone IbpA